MLKDKFQQRFTELGAGLHQLPFQSSENDSLRYVPNGSWQHLGTSAQSLILAVFGESSPHYVNFVNAYNGCNGYEHSVKTLISIFDSAKEDFEGGYVFDVDLRVSGEVFGDFVALAKQSLSEGHMQVAAVLACASLEDALKRYASANGIDTDERSMKEVVNALKSKGLVHGAQKSLLDAMPRIRNAALHAEWGKLSDPDVNSVIGYVEQFLLSNFSGD